MEKMMKGVSPLRLFSRASPNKPAQDTASPNVPPAGAGGRAPLSSIPEAAFNPVLRDANSGDLSSPPRKADPSTPRERKKSSALGQGGSYPHLENLDVSSTPPASGTSRGTSKSHFTWHQRKPSSNALEAASDAQGPGSASAQPVSVKSVSRALKYNVHQSSSTSSVASAGGRPPPSTTLNVRTPNVPKYGPPPPSTVNNTDQQFDLEEDPSFWRDHNVQVLIRTRPLNSSEIAAQGYARCLRQDSAHMITWTGQPESRFTFDHVACESITQEKLFRVAGLPMVDNCIAGYNSCMFAYGQTGSGKTHTMLGDIDNLDNRPSSNRGMTPRVFEYLFARIRHEEEARRNERLKYHCKCSFLEIYNEQITDLLEPTSNNLQMREDAKNGVYVENLTEVEVLGVQDVIQLLLQGAANRKVAATNMNRESSRSHSVFTCVVESKWEYDSMKNTRYGRLNLVDLAGSERQKSSGAEGERLKEAANINKSLSTLGLVIMVLVDIANGKQRHVPYRDSKLTFLLQDSLGGNSKTTIIANVSPSSCCSMETLSTLKFAQRAKFIRNNAVVNEDATADVIALRGEIQQLKDELSRVRRQGASRSASFRSSIPLREANGSDEPSLAIVGFNNGGDALRRSVDSSWDSTRQRALSTDKAKRVESLLAGSMRREQEAESTSKRLAAEIEQLNRLVRHREEDTQCTKMMLRFREDKIRRLESVADGILSAEECLMEEKAALQEELQLLRARIDRNPELTRFAMENIRLMEEVRRYQEFYEGMERETLLQEIGTLRDQLIEAFEGKALDANSLTPTTPQASQPTDAASLRNAEEFMQLQLQLESYEAVVEEKDRQRKELEAKCSELHHEVCHLTEKLERALEDKSLDQSATACKLEEAEDAEEIAPCSIGHSTIAEGRAPDQASMSQASSLRESRALDTAASMRHAEEIMHLQLQLESYEAMLEEGQAVRTELETKCSNLDAQVDQLTVKLEDVEKKLLPQSSVNAAGLQAGLPDAEKNRAPSFGAFESRAEPSEEIEVTKARPPRMDVDAIRVNSISPQKELTSSDSGSGISFDDVIQLQLRVECYEAVLTEELNNRKELEGRCKELNEQVGKLTEQINNQLERERQMDITRGQAETETAQTIKLLHSELMELKKGTGAARDSPGAEKMRELLNELESRALHEAAVELDDIIDDTFSLRLSIDHNIPRSQAVNRTKSLELLQRKLETARTLAQETESQFQALSSFVLDISSSHQQEKDALVEEIRLSQKRREELEAETAALASDLENLRTALKAHEESVRGLERKWKQEKDQLLLEVHEARLTAKEKGSESATLLQRFEEGQSILLELEQTMNALVRANATKTDSEKAWKKEKDGLLSELEEAKLFAQDTEAKIQGLISKVESLQGQVKENEQVIVGMQEEVLDTRSVEREAENVWKREREELLCGLQNATQMAKEKDSEAAALRNNYEECQALLSDLQSRMKDLVSTNEKLMSDAHSLQFERERERVELEQTVSALETVNADKTESERGWKREKDGLLSALQEANISANDSEAKIEGLKSRVESLKAQVKETEQVIVGMQEEVLNTTSLQRQAEKAWKQEREELLCGLQNASQMAKEKDSEAAALLQNYEECQTLLRDLQSRMNDLVSTNEKLMSDAQSLHVERERERVDLEQTMNALVRANATKTESEKEWKTEKDGLLSDLHEAKRFAIDSEAKIEGLNSRVESLQGAVNEKEQVIVGMQEELLDTRSLEREAEKVWKQEREELLCVLQNATQMAKEKDSEAAALRQNYEECQALLRDLQSRMNDLVSTNEKLMSDVHSLHVERERERAEFEQTMNALVTENSTKTESEKEWKREKDGLLSDLDEARRFANDSEAKIEGLNSRVDSLKGQVKEKEQVIVGIQEEVLKIRSLERELQEVVSRLQQENSTHSLCIAKSVEEKQMLVRVWEETINTLKLEHEQALKLKEEEMSQLTTAHGQVVKERAADTLLLQAQVENRRDETSSLQQTLEKNAVDHELLVSNLRQDFSLLLQEYERLSVALNEEREDKKALSTAHDAAISQLKAEINRVESHLQNLREAEVSQLKADVAKLEGLREEHELKIAAITFDKEKMVIEVEETSQLVQELESKLSKLQELREEHELKIAAITADKEKMVIEVEETSHLVQDLESKLSKLQELLTSKETELQMVLEDNQDALASKEESLARLSAVLETVTQEKDAEIVHLRKNYDECQALLMDLQSRMNDLVTTNEKLMCDAQSFDVERESVRLAYEKYAVMEAKLLRTEEVKKGLEVDIVRLQESATELTVKREEAARLGAAVENLEHELAIRCEELRETKFSMSKLEITVYENEKVLNSVSDELLEAKAEVEGLHRRKTDSEKDWKREKDGLLSELDEAKLFANDSMGKIQGLESRVESLQGQVKEKQQVIVGMQKEVLDTRSLEREAEKVWKQEREELLCGLENATQRAKERDLEAAGLRQKYEECQVKLRDLQSRMNDLVSTNEKLMSDAQSLHVERERVRLAYEKYGVMEAKLHRTEEVKKGLEFDISLLQESAAELTVKREEAARLGAAVENLDQQLEKRCQELREMKLSMSKLETAMYEKEKLLNSLSDDLLEAKAELEGLRRSKVSTKAELQEKKQWIADLGMEVLDATSGEDTTRSLKKKLNYAIKERNRLHAELVVLTEQLDMAHSIAEDQESLATESRQAALASKVLAEGKDAEVRLLERSVEELESTVNALESQVGIVKREGERQRLLREDLEMELQSLRHHMSTVQDSTEEKDILVLPARKDGTLLVSSNKSVERPKTKPSGSPFKCGSKGLVQQLHSDIDDEIYANRQRIEELEGIAAARQKEVFMLHTRLAEAESMTHDVIRDLLGVKLDITNCASLLSQEKVQEIAEAARKRTDEAKEKDAELSSVRAQLTEFIEERESWLEEINRRQAEMVAARVAAEKLRVREQTLTAENERLQRETSSQRKRVLELEGEVKKLSGQQNLQQRIHHHAKIKEENNQLRTQNEDLSNRLRRTETVLARVSDELARYRTAEGNTPFLNIDEEHRLKNRLKEEEDNRTQIAQKLISICTAVMKAAGVGYSSTEMDSDVAVRAVYQLEERLKAAERELSDMRLHSRVAGEKRRLSELRAVHSPYRTNFTAGIQVSSPRSDR